MKFGKYKKDTIVRLKIENNFWYQAVLRYKKQFFKLEAEFLILKRENEEMRRVIACISDEKLRLITSQTAGEPPC